jgi:hypothetical protein
MKSAMWSGRRADNAQGLRAAVPLPRSFASGGPFSRRRGVGVNSNWPASSTVKAADFTPPRGFIREREVDVLIGKAPTPRSCRANETL